MLRKTSLGILVAALAISAGIGCTPEQYAQQADVRAYDLVQQKQQVALGAPRPFDIDYDPLGSPMTPVPIGPDDSVTAAPLTMPAEGPALTVSQCLTIAFRNSRSFQTRKENLYASALSLSEARHEWSLLGGDASAEVSRTVVEGESYDWSGEGNLGLSFVQQFVNGGALSLGLGLELASDLLGWDSTVIGSNLSANFTQPLVRGAWRGFAYESLYRQERDLAIAVLEYERFRQTFSTDIVEQFYRVLQGNDQLENERESILRLRQTYNFIRVQVQAGERSRVQQDQAEQDLLNAQIRLTESIQRYQDTLDQFKLTLGLPIESEIRLDDMELSRLNARVAETLNVDPNQAGSNPAAPVTTTMAIPFTLPEAIDVAFDTRPDVLRRRAGLRDANRDVQIAADRFNPAIDLMLDFEVSGTEPHQPWQMRWNEHRRFAALELDYTFDQTRNRNNYRNTLIDLARTWREYDQFVDQVRLEVRRQYRQLIQAEQSYRLQARNVAVARQRSLLADREQRAGLASTRDVLEAQEALRRAQNGLTSALISYETTRIAFLAQLGMLEVDENGQIHERNDPFTTERIRRRYEETDEQIRRDE